MDQQKVPMNNWIVWLALLMSVTFYAGLAVFSPFKNNTPLDEQTRMILTDALGAISLSIMLLITAFRRVLAKALPYNTYSILRWAMCEAIAIFGLVLSLVGASLTISCAFITAGAVSLLITRPTDGSLEDYDDQKK
jgi:hypothetical protein